MKDRNVKIDDEKINRRTSLFVVTLASFITPFMGSSTNIALPSIGKEFAMDAVLLGWVSTAYLLSAAVFLVPIGRVADIYGRKRIFRIGIMIYTISSFLSAIAPSSYFLIAVRVLQGVGGSMIFGTGVAILTSIYPPGERGKVLGINAASVYLGLSLGPFLGGFLTHHLGWRSVFWVNIPLGFLIIVIVILKLKGEWAEAKGEKFDFGGSIIYAIVLVALIYGLSQLPNILGYILILIGVLGLFVFFKWEIKISNPVLNMRLFKNNAVFAFSNLAALINYSTTFAVTFLLSLYLQYIKGLTPREAGLILVCQPVIMAIFSPFIGRLSDKAEPRIISSIGMALTVIALLIFSFINKTTELPLVICGLVILGLGLAFFSSPNTNAIMSSVEKKFYGVASGTLGTMRLTGQMFSMGIAMLIFALIIGRVQITPEYHPHFLLSIKTIFIIFAVLCFGGIFASLARGKVH